jgi:tetrathionate reductase subunit B
MQYAMVIDLNKCIGCHTCTIACKAAWNVPAEHGRNWVKRLGPAQTPEGLAATWYPGQCNHCDSPVCVAVCPAEKIMKTFKDAKTGRTTTLEVAATYKNPFNGIVQVDQDRCLGCGECAAACPYEARYMDEDRVNEELGSDGTVDKCTFCQPRVEAGLQPVCVQACLAGARIFGDITDPDSEVSGYREKGAVSLSSSVVNIGSNGLYFGNKRDMSLLVSTQTPTAMSSVNHRRQLLARIKPAVKKAKNFGMLGLLGAAALKGLEDDQE